MKILVYVGMGLGALWLQLTVGEMLSFAWFKPNLLLLTVVLAGLRWMDPWLFLYAAAAGLGQDVFSHGMLGVYGISFFLTSFAARIAGVSVYEHNLLFSVAGVFGLCVTEGVISVTLLDVLDSNVPWWSWMFERVVPAAVYNSLLTPLVIYGMYRLERWLKWSTT